MKLWPLAGIAAMQTLLALAHWFLYRTWVDFWPPLNPSTLLALRIAFCILACSFMAAALLSFRSASHFATWLYRLAAVWLGFLNFFFWAACASWIVWGALWLALPAAQAAPFRPWICALCAAAGAAAGLWGMINARWIRIKRIEVKLADLPEHWRGRKALVMSDLHLGHINGAAFAERVVRMANHLAPDVVFIPGDLFDGGQAHVERLLAPFAQLNPPHGVYFSSGNHDEFGNMEEYRAAMEQVGIHVLANQATLVDGLAVIGIGYGDANFPIRMRALLQELRPAPGVAAVLLNHVPTRLPIAEEAGIGLQLSGHTHAGQIFPFTWITRRIFGRFTHGLAHYGSMAVYTSTGAGAWGPPMRVGTDPEMVLIHFESATA